MEHGRNATFLGIQKSESSVPREQGFGPLLPPKISWRLLVNATALPFMKSEMQT